MQQSTEVGRVTQPSHLLIQAALIWAEPFPDPRHQHRQSLLPPPNHRQSLRPARLLQPRRQLMTIPKWKSHRRQSQMQHPNQWRQSQHRNRILRQKRPTRPPEDSGWRRSLLAPAEPPVGGPACCGQLTPHLRSTSGSRTPILPALPVTGAEMGWAPGPATHFE